MIDEELKRQIQAHLAIVLGRESGDLPAAIAGLDSLKGSTRGHLSHYLEKRSYAKAWILLEGENPEKGVCS
jgi:hypothetical protein